MAKVNSSGSSTRFRSRRRSNPANFSCNTWTRWAGWAAGRKSRSCSIASSFPLDPVLQKMYLARTNAQLGEKAASENNWQRALETAHGDPQKLVMLASYAEKNGALDVARAAYDEAAAESPRLRAAHQGRLRLAQGSGETKKIHAVLVDMLAIWPNDPAVQNDEAYTRSAADARSEDGSQRRIISEEGGSKAIEELAAKLVEREAVEHAAPHLARAGAAAAGKI